MAAPAAKVDVFGSATWQTSLWYVLREWAAITYYDLMALRMQRQITPILLDDLDRTVTAYHD